MSKAKVAALRNQYQALRTKLLANAKGTQVIKIDIPAKACCLCSQTGSDDGQLYGPLVEKHLGNDVTFNVHTLCLKTVPDLSQKFDDETLLPSNEQEEGEFGGQVNGFDIADLLSVVLRRTQKHLTCAYESCASPAGALVGCANNRCRKTYHTPCARQAGSLIMFRHTFPLHCPSHIPHEEESKPIEILNRRRGKLPVDTCIICHDDLQPRRQLLAVVEHLCMGGTRMFMHFECAQNLACVQRTELKCPLTTANADNNTDQQLSVEEHSEELHFLLTSAGVYVPDGMPTYATIEEDEQALPTLANIGRMEHDPKAPCYRGKDCYHRTTIGELTDKYDEYYDSKESAELLYNAFEMIGPCTTCGRYSHRRCAGLPWAYTELAIPRTADDAEPEFVCRECRVTDKHPRCPPWMLSSLRRARRRHIREKKLPMEFFFPDHELVDGTHPDLHQFNTLFGYNVLVAPPTRKDTTRRRGLQLYYTQQAANKKETDMVDLSDDDEVELGTDGKKMDTSSSKSPTSKAKSKSTNQLPSVSNVTNERAAAGGSSNNSPNSSTKRTLPSTDQQTTSFAQTAKRSKPTIASCKSPPIAAKSEASSDLAVLLVVRGPQKPQTPYEPLTPQERFDRITDWVNILPENPSDGCANLAIVDAADSDLKKVDMVKLAAKCKPRHTIDVVTLD